MARRFRKIRYDEKKGLRQPISVNIALFIRLMRKNILLSAWNHHARSLFKHSKN